MKPLRTLIFSVSIGAGHDSVAKALAERLLIDSPTSEVNIIDTFQYINGALHKVVMGSYMETLKFTPKVWGYLYNQAQEGDMLIDLGQLLSKLLSPKLEQLLNNYKPDVILTTHAFPTGMLAVLKKRGQLNIPLAAAITDFHVHSFWIHPEVDRFYLPAQDLAYSLKKYNISSAKIKGTGIPIRSQFTVSQDKHEARKLLNIAEKTTLLVMGGGWGLGKIERITKELLKNEEFQVLVIAGKNKELETSLLSMQNERLKVFGFVENMVQVMAASDIVISKPGGVTIAEILAVGKPLAIYSSLPGQEDRNTEYLLNRGAAIRVRNIDMLIPEILSLWHNPLRRNLMEGIAGELGNPISTQMIWEDIRDLIKERADKVVRV